MSWEFVGRWHTTFNIVLWSVKNLISHARANVKKILRRIVNGSTGTSNKALNVSRRHVKTVRNIINRITCGEGHMLVLTVVFNCRSETVSETETETETEKETFVLNSKSNCEFCVEIKRNRSLEGDESWWWHHSFVRYAMPFQHVNILNICRPTCLNARRGSRGGGR